MKKILVAIFMIASLAAGFDSVSSLNAGYVRSSYNAKQNLQSYWNPNRDIDGSANSLELGWNMSFYIGEPNKTFRWGWSLGLGTEFTSISWDRSLMGYDANGIVKASSSDFLWTLTPQVGVFFDVLHLDNDMRLKIFANLGISSNLLSGTKYDGVDHECTYSNYGYICSTESSLGALNWAATVPLTVGARWHFTKKHAIELAFKTDLNEMEFENTDKTIYFNGAFNSYKDKTTISRDFSVALRYVFEFGQDW